MRNFRYSLFAAVAVAAIGLASPVKAQPYGYGPGYGMMGGGYGPGWMMGRGYGPGMMGGYGPGYGMTGGYGPGYMMGSGYGPGYMMRGYGGYGQVLRYQFVIDPGEILSRVIRQYELGISPVHADDP